VSLPAAKDVVAPVSMTQQGIKARPKAAPVRTAARPKKLAAAGGGSEEWEEF